MKAPTRDSWPRFGIPLLRLALVVAIVACWLRWGGFLLIKNDDLPSHVETAVVLQGSIKSEKLRIAGAMRLLEQGTAEQALLSVPKESYWGQSIAPAARNFLLKNYGAQLASRVDFCETDSNVDSTEQEAQSLYDCIRQHGWRSLLVVTSNYHTRRAGIIWRRVIGREAASPRLSIYGVTDPSFSPQGWWRKRVYAKTWFLETTKLVALLFGG